MSLKMQETAISPIKVQDLEELSKAYQKYFNEKGDHWTLAQVQRRLRQLLTMEDFIGLKITAKDQLFGFALGYLKVYDDLLLYYLDEILILREYQNKGHGTALMNAIEGEAKAQGAQRMALDAYNDESHRQFYSRLGFVPSSTILPFGKDI